MPLPSTATDCVDTGLLMTLTVTTCTDETVCPSQTISLSTIAGKVNVYITSRAKNPHRRLIQFLPCDAMLSAVYAVVVCLCLFVCLSDTLQYCIKMAKRRITQIMPHDSRDSSFQMGCFVVKSIVWHYLQMDGQTDTRRRHIPRLA